MKRHRSVRRAAVDIGTNSTRLLIADVKDDTQVMPVLYREELTRLGAGFQPDGSLDEAAVQRVVAAVTSFIAGAKENAAEEARLFATSAVRDAADRDQVVRRIQNQSGKVCRVLSGEEEARLTFLGASSGIERKGRWLLCDVGGGSTEFIAAEGGTMVWFASLQLGSSRETRRFLSSDPPTPEEQRALGRHVESELRTLPSWTANLLVASGGTAFTAAALCENSRVADPFELEGRSIRKNELNDLIARMTQKPLAERRAVFGLTSERAEVLPAGLMIYREIISFFGLQSVKITLRDALFGAVLEKEWPS